METKLAVLNIICGVLQILGLVLIVGLGFYSFPRGLWAIVAISGFAGVVRFFITDFPEGVTKFFINTGALAGLGIVLLVSF